MRFERRTLPHDCGDFADLRRARRHHHARRPAAPGSTLQRCSAHPSHSCGFERNLPAGRGRRLRDPVSAARFSGGSYVSLGDGTGAEGCWRGGVCARLFHSPLAGVIPRVRGKRRRAGAAHAVGAYFVISSRAIGYSPTRTHWAEPYFANSSTFASTKWVFFSMSWRGSTPV